MFASNSVLNLDFIASRSMILPIPLSRLPPFAPQQATFLHPSTFLLMLYLQLISTYIVGTRTCKLTNDFMQHSFSRMM